MARKNSPSVFEISNRAAISTSSDGSSTVANDLSNHLNMSSINAHQIINIIGLQTVLDGKQNIASGHTGTIDIVTGVNFTAQTVTKVTINVSNGIIISIN